MKGKKWRRSPEFVRQGIHRKLNTSVEVHGMRTPHSRLNISMGSQSARGAIGMQSHQRVHRVVSNLAERKNTVLRIAAENFLLIKRLERVRSAIGPGGCQKHRPVSLERRSSIAIAYPNVLDTSKMPGLTGVIKTPKFKKIVTLRQPLANLTPLDA